MARLAEQIRPAASHITAVAGAAGSYADLGVRTIADIRPGLGPLAGLEAAIIDARQLPGLALQWIVVLSCDMTAVAPEWIELLASARRNDSLAMNFVDSTGRRHPFPGLFHVDLLTTVLKCLDDRSLSVQRLINSVSHVEVAAPRDWPAVAQVNTQEDLRNAAS
jgi:molybdopterin-guanine dinucleotide biosynthesis protein A